ncbi:MAG: sensor domain-containing diguanylate cyclase, partial [Clostridiales bacterium]|nr:sensor domain-containing diguanylate cyclase [Clostridiales bacterium]
LIAYCHYVEKKHVTVIAPSMRVYEDLSYLLTNIEGCDPTSYDLLVSTNLRKPWFGEPIATTHTDELSGKCFGYRLFIDDANVIYTGDTNTLIPFEKHLTEGSVLYTEVSSVRSDVHIYCEDLKNKVSELTEKGVRVYLMHMDNEIIIGNTMKGTGAEFAPLEGGNMENNGQLLNNIFGITDSLYKDMCMNNSQDHALLFSYLTELAKTLVDADRASFWKWDKRKQELWTMSATGVDKIVMPDSNGLVGKSLREKRTVITNDPYSDPDFNPSIDKKTGYVTKSVLVLPVADVNGNFIGALQLINKNDGRGFSEEEDSKRLSLAALVCGIALESEVFLEDSHHDRLTGLKNRMAFYYDFGGKFKEYLLPSSGKQMSLFICDIDKFKRVNDTYGHNAGDDVLKFASSLIESTCSEKESVYRWGGEEFVMVMRDADLAYAANKAEEVRVKLMESDIDADGTVIRCTMSFGCAAFDPNRSIEENISSADARLYVAKETGRNKVVSTDEN